LIIKFLDEVPQKINNYPILQLLSKKNSFEESV
jgi:hypothetical protein